MAAALTPNLVQCCPPWNERAAHHVTLNLAISVLIMCGIFKQVPVELVEASRIGGCGRWRTLIHWLFYHYPDHIGWYLFSFFPYCYLCFS